MTNEYELADHTREATIFEKDQLLAPLAGTMLPAPHPMVEGTTEKNYYRNEITGPTDAQREWVTRRDVADADPADGMDTGDAGSNADRPGATGAGA